MRVHVISDMEGICGITKPEQVEGGESLYEEGRRLYTEEINAAVRGARAGGATEVIVMDCHGAGKGWTFNSLIPEALEEKCEFVVQDTWTGYTAALEEGCDAALLVGMHARAGTELGVLNHTVSGSQWQNLAFNGVAVGEIGINAALCGTWGCPVAMVSGDSATCQEAEELLSDGVVTVAVKEGLGQHSARHLHPARARELIEEGSQKAVASVGELAPYEPGRPCEIKVEFMQSGLAGPYRHRAGVEVLDGRRIVSSAGDWWTAWKQLYF